MRHALLVFAALLALSCAPPGKRQAASLIAAVDAYRRADGQAKVAAGRALVDVPCSEDAVCAAKRACAGAVEPTQRALALKDEVAAQVSHLEHGTLEAGSPEAATLPAKLEEADRLLREGRDRMRACDAELVKLHVDLGV